MISDARCILLEKASSPLPDLPDTLKHKQDTMMSLPVAIGKPPPTRAHTRGPTVPADEKNVYGM
jgi:hypothetical protein